MPAFLDMNVLVYAFDLGEPEKREVARSLIQEHLMAGDGMISVQVLREFYSAWQRATTPLWAEEAADAVEYLAAFSPSPEDPRTVVRAVERVRDGFSFWDALIVESALRGGQAPLRGHAGRARRRGDSYREPLRLNSRFRTRWSPPRLPVRKTSRGSFPDSGCRDRRSLQSL